jgi:hypothetical protein
MKTLKLLFTFALFFLVITACKKDTKEDPPTTPETINVEKSTVSAKWEVEGDSDYTTLEFNESGTYVVVKTSPDKDISGEIILFGTYTIEGDQLILSNFGRIKITSISDEKMTFTIKLEGESEFGETLTANKSEELPASTNTQLLCRTWKLITLNGDTVAGTEMELLMVFYQSGTYVVTYIEDEELGGLAEWKWRDANEDVMCYSWDGPPDCSALATINELTTDILDVSDDSFRYILVPENNAKSAQFFQSQMQNASEKGIFPLLFQP